MENQDNVNVGMGNEGDSKAPIIGVIVIIVIIILGGYYFWNQRIANQDVVTDPILLQNNSDVSDTIEVDIEATDIENLDAELNAS